MNVSPWFTWVSEMLVSGGQRVFLLMTWLLVGVYSFTWE